MGVFWNNKLGNITQEESDLLMTANSPKAYQEIMEELKRRREMNQEKSVAEMTKEEVARDAYENGFRDGREMKMNTLNHLPSHKEAVDLCRKDLRDSLKGSGQTLIPSSQQEVAPGLSGEPLNRTPFNPRLVGAVHRCSDEELLTDYAAVHAFDREEVRDEILRRMKR